MRGSENSIQFNLLMKGLNLMQGINKESIVQEEADNITQFTGQDGTVIKLGSRVRLSWAGEEGQPQQYNRPATVGRFLTLDDIVAEIFIDPNPEGKKKTHRNGFSCLCYAKDLRPIE